MQPDSSRSPDHAWPWPVCYRRVGVDTAAPRMRVSLVFIEHRINVWLRFGRPASMVTLDHWRSVATFEPGRLCCRIRWAGNGRARALFSAVVLQAPCGAMSCIGWSV
jgi:hypothetical protein